MLLNLLSPKKQQERRHEELMNLLKMIVEFFFILVSCFAMILLITSLFLQDQVTTLTVTTNVLPALRSLDQRVRLLNSEADRLSKRQEEFERLSPLLIDLSTALPNGTHFTNLSIDTKIKKVTLNGVAQSRQNILELEKNLSTIKSLEHVVVPFTNLLTKENPLWTVTATIQRP